MADCSTGLVSFSPELALESAAEALRTKYAKIGIYCVSMIIP